MTAKIKSGANKKTSGFPVAGLLNKQPNISSV